VRRLLLISYWFPPALGAAAERMSAFARYLPDNAWQVDVLTSGRGAQTPGLSKDPGGQTSGLSNYQASQTSNSAVPLLPSGEPVMAPGPTPAPTIHYIPDRLARSATRFADYDPRIRPSRLKRWLREFVFPDRFVAWQCAALAVGRELLSSTRYDAILASFPPASAVSLGVQLHRDSRLPLILDFRDRWIGPGGYEPHRARNRARHETLEREAIAAASGVVTVSDAMARDFAARFQLDPARVGAIPNGFASFRAPSASDGPPTLSPWENAGVRDETGARSETQSSAPPFTLAHVGTVIPRNRPDLFFNSVAELKRRGAMPPVRTRFVGNLSAAYVRDAGLADVIETTGLVPRDAAASEMRAADALLLLTGDYVGRWGYNAKLFEYLAAGRPILCLEELPDSNDAALLRQLAPQRTVIARLGVPDALADSLQRLLAFRGSPCQPTPPSALAPYDRRMLTARLAAFLDRVIPL